MNLSIESFREGTDVAKAAVGNTKRTVERTAAAVIHRINPFNSPFDPYRRRLIVQGAEITGGLIFLGAALDILTSCSPQVSEGDIVKVEAASTVKRYTEEIGDGIVDFELASRLIPPISDLFTQSTRSPESSQAVKSQIFVARGSFVTNGSESDPTLDQIHQIPGVQQLLEDYPKASFSPITISKLFRYFRTNTIRGFVDGQRNVFLNLTNINKNKQNLSRPWSDYSGDLMYSGIGGAVPCQPLTPVVSFVSSALHELGHRETLDADHLIDPELMKTLAKKYPKVNPIFMAGFDIYTAEGFKIILLDELVADYTGAKISTVNGLWYSPSINSFPYDIYNFEKLLQGSKISGGEFLSLHRGGKLKSFLIKIGAAASKNQGNGDNPLDIGVDIATMVSVPLAVIPIHDWESVSKYFPEIDVSDYNYFSPQSMIMPGAIQGCVHP